MDYKSNDNEVREAAKRKKAENDKKKLRNQTIRTVIGLCILIPIGLLIFASPALLIILLVYFVDF